jgi:hypothetical protein
VGQIESMALPYESYKLAFTPGLLAQVYQRNQESLLLNPVDALGGQAGDRGGYLDLDGNGRWWIPSGRVFYSPDPTVTPPPELSFALDHFFLPHRYRDPFHTDLVRTETFVGYDSYDLLMQQCGTRSATRFLRKIVKIRWEPIAKESSLSQHVGCGIHRSTKTARSDELPLGEKTFPSIKPAAHAPTRLSCSPHSPRRTWVLLKPFLGSCHGAALRQGLRASG